jgi:hypothetical protein
MNQPDEANPETIFRTWITIWGAILMSSLMFALMAWFIGQPTQLAGGDNFTVLFAALFFAASGAVGVSFVLKNKQLARAVAEQSPAILQSGYIVAWALCEAAALFGLVGVFVTKASAFFALMALGALGLALHFPKRDDLHATTFKKL